MFLFTDNNARSFLEQLGITENSSLNDWKIMWRNNYSEIIGTNEEQAWYESKLKEIIALKSETRLVHLVSNGYEQALHRFLEDNPASNLSEIRTGFSQHSLLHIAVLKKHLPITSILITQGCDWSKLNKEMKSPIFLIFTSSDTDFQLTCFKEMLLSLNGNKQKLFDILSTCDKAGDNFLHYCAIRGNSQLANLVKNELPAEQRITLLTKKGSNGSLPLHKAILNSNDLTPFYTSSLLTSTNDEGKNLYLFCIQNNRLEHAQFFIKQGINPEQTDFKGNNAWHIALENRHSTIVPLLEKYNAAQKDTPNRLGEKPNDLSQAKNENGHGTRLT